MIVQFVRSTRTVYIIVFALLLLTIGMVLVSLHDIERNAKRKILASNLGVSSLSHMSFEKVPAMVKHALAQTPGISIDVKFLDLTTVMKDRERALNSGILEDPSWVPATVSYSGNNFEAAVSLKGDLADHWKNEDKFSLKVKLKDGFIEGYERFSIQAPYTRQYPDNDIFLSFAKTNDVMANTMFYLPVTFNGMNWGVMNIEPTVDKYFLELAKEKDSLALKFDDQVEWNYRIKSAANEYISAYKVFDSLFDINLMQKKAFSKQELKQQMFSYLLNKLRLSDKIILDEEKFCKAIVLSEIWNNQHAIHKSNTRYYFNPYTLKIEPILSDQGNYTKIASTTQTINPKLYHLDERFRLIAHEDNTSYRDCLASALKSISAKMVELDDITMHLHRHFPNDNEYNVDILKSNIEFIEKNFDTIFFPKLSSPKLNKIPDSLSHNQLFNMKTWVGLQQFNDGSLWLFNRLPINIKLLEISNGVEQFTFTYKDQILHPQDKLLSGYPTKNFIATPSIFQTNFVNKEAPITVSLEVDGLQRKVTSEMVLPSYRRIHNPLEFDPNKVLPNFIEIENDKCRIKGNQTIIVKNPLILNCQLIIEGGVNLKFTENAYLIVIGSLIIGSLDSNPVTMESLNSDQKWKGLYVVGNNSDVIIQNMKVSNISALSDGLLNLTGALSFYETNLEINKLDIENSLAEDAINVINSNFKFTNVSIVNTKSDAIDLDFSNGDVSKLYLSKIGGDAIDLSGSDVRLFDIDVFEVGDKALSIGESSKIDASNINISKAGVGIAVKDGSYALANNINMRENYYYDYMTYKKKDFYNTPSLYLIQKEECNFKYSRSENSLFFCNNALLSVIEEDIAEIYESGFMQKDGKRAN